jgi:hypothetical protein
VAVNLNEENPLRPETAGDIVLFNFPFTIGTYPKLAFNIDDDDDDDDDEQVETVQNDDIASDHSSEYDQIAEKMKDLELETNPPQMVQEESSSVTRINPTCTPSSSFYDITPLKRLDDTEVNNSTSYITSSVKKVADPVFNKPNTPDEASPVEEQYNHPIPKMEYTSNLVQEPQSPTSTSEPTSPTNHTRPVISTPPPELPTKPTPPPLTRPNLQINPSLMFNDYQPVVSPIGPPPTSPLAQRHNSAATMRPSNSSSTVHSGIGRQESVRWIVRNQEAATPAAVAAASPTTITSPNIPPRLPPRPTAPAINNNQVFVMPTPSLSQPTATSIHHQNNNYHPQPGTHHYASGNYHLQPSHSSQTSSMPMPQQYQQFPPYTNHPQYGYSQNYDYSNNHHHHHNNNGNVAFPVPQQPGYSGGFMSMPSHQNYQPQPSTYYNH